MRTTTMRATWFWVVTVYLGLMAGVVGGGTPATQPSKGGDDGVGASKAEGESATVGTVARLVRALSDPDNDKRAKAAEALRPMLAAEPGSAPEYHDRDYWVKEMGRVEIGWSVEEVIRTLLPKATPAEREKALLGGHWSGQSGVSILRLDDYWTVTLYLGGEGAKLMQAPVLNQSVRAVWVAPPAEYTGTWVTWFVNGQKASEIQYRNGQYDGTLTHFHDNGNKNYEQHYTKNICESTDKGWYRGGAKSYEGQYKDGKRDGTWRHWFENGQLKSEASYWNGKEDGRSTMWLESGQKRYEVHYQEGKKEGLDRAWDEKGNLLWTRMFRQGELVEAK